MANWDFSIDSEKQKSLSEVLNQSADDFDDKKEALYKQIDSMGESGAWVGDDYNAFNAGTHNYESALQDLSNGFRMFGKHFELMSRGTEDLATELIQIIENMTGDKSAVSGGDVYVAGSNTSPGEFASDDAEIHQNDGSRDIDLTQNNTIDSVSDNASDTSDSNDSTSNAYVIETNGTTAKEMYEDAKDLSSELYEEIEYLTGYKGNLEFARGQLEIAHNNGSINDSDYNELLGEYNSRIELCDAEFEKRANLYNSLNELTANKLGTKDGILKDAQDWDSNDFVAASQALVSVNNDASKLTPLSDIVSETNYVTGESKMALQVSALRNPEFSGVDYGSYTENLNAVANGNGTTISNLTMKAAFTAAGDNVEEVAGESGVYLFNASNYLSNNQEIYQGGNDSIISEVSALYNTNNYNGYDCVYDSNTGKYYTYSDYVFYRQNR